jgi:hypothetical protein
MGAELLVFMLLRREIIWVLIFENPLISEVITNNIEINMMMRVVH